MDRGDEQAMAGEDVYPAETEADGYDVVTGEPVYDTYADEDDAEYAESDDADPEEMERLYEERLAARRAERQARHRARVRRAWFYRILAAFVLIEAGRDAGECAESGQRCVG